MGTLLDCGHPESKHSGFTTGYGTDNEGRKHCYDCCAKQDREYMIATGKISLYLTRDSNGLWRVSNWPGSLVFKPWHVKEWKASAFGGYIGAATAWFVGPDGYVWTAVRKGDMDLCRCKRTKERAKVYIADLVK